MIASAWHNLNEPLTRCRRLQQVIPAKELLATCEGEDFSGSIVVILDHAVYVGTGDV